MNTTAPSPPALDESGAFDLPSILVGVVTVGVLTAGVLASVFGVIPFSQDNSAKQDLSSIRTAEGVAKAQHGGYTDKAGLARLKLVSPLSAATQVYANGAAFCATTVSQTGKSFSIASTLGSVVDGNTCSAGDGTSGAAIATGGTVFNASDPWIIQDPALRTAVISAVGGGTVAPASFTSSTSTGTTITMVRASYETSISAASVTATTTGYQLTMGDAKKLTHLDASGLGVTSLEGLQYATNMTSLNVFNNSIADLGPISNMGLTTLNVANNPVTKLDPLAGDSALTTLDISSTSVTDVSVMSGMGALTNVTANWTAVPDWSPANHVATVTAPWFIADAALRNSLSRYTAMTVAGARTMGTFDATSAVQGGTGDFTALKAMTTATLSFTATTQADLAKAQLLPNLKSLTLGSDVTDLSGLASLPSLTQLESIDAFYSSARDLGSLSGAKYLKTLKVPYLTADLSPIAGLANLENLDLNISQVTDLGPLSGLTNMKTLVVNTYSSDFTPLSGLHNMVILTMSNNRNLDSFQPFAEMSKLENLMYSNTPLASHYATADFSPVAHVRYVAMRPANYGMTSDQLATDWVVPDVALRNAITDNLGKPNGAPLTYSDAGQVWSLTLPAGVSSLQGLEHAKGMEQLSISNTGVTDLSPLKDLSLRYLWANGTGVTDWSPVAYVGATAYGFVSGRP